LKEILSSRELLWAESAIRRPLRFYSPKLALHCGN
jgi:hypothetical protein